MYRTEHQVKTANSNKSKVVVRSKVEYKWRYFIQYEQREWRKSAGNYNDKWIRYREMREGKGHEDEIQNTNDNNEKGG